MATDTEGRASIPRMRTAAKIVAEIKAADPGDRKSTRLNSSHITRSRMPSSA